MSIINAGNTTTTAFRVTGDTTGNVLIQSNGTNVATINTAGIILSTGTALYYPDGSSSNTAASAVAGAVNVTLQQGYGGF
jgi:hypothetical protein